MANATSNLSIRSKGRGGYKANLPVAASTHLYTGTMVSQDDTSGGLEPTTTATSGQCVGVVTHEADNSSGAAGDIRAEIETERIFEFDNDGTNPFDETMDLGTTAYAVDDHTVSDTQTVAEPVAGIFMGMEASGKVAILVSPRTP